MNDRNEMVTLITLLPIVSRCCTSYLMEKKRGDGVQRGWHLPRLQEEESTLNDVRERKTRGCERREMKRQMRTGQKQTARLIVLSSNATKENKTAPTETHVPKNSDGADDGASSSEEDPEKLSLFTVPIHPREKKRFDSYLDRKHGEEVRYVLDSIRPPQRLALVHPQTATHGRGRRPKKTQSYEPRRRMRPAPGRGRGRMMTTPYRMDNAPLERGSVRTRDPSRITQTQPHRLPTRPRMAHPRRQYIAAHQADGQQTRHVKQMTMRMRRDWSHIPRDFLISVIERIHRSNVTLLLEMDML